MHGFEIITRQELDPNRQNDILLYEPGEQRGDPSRVISPEEEILLVRKDTFRAAKMQVGINSYGHIFLRFFDGVDPAGSEKLVVLDSSSSSILLSFVQRSLRME